MMKNHNFYDETIFPLVKTISFSTYCLSILFFVLLITRHPTQAMRMHSLLNMRISRLTLKFLMIEKVTEWQATFF